MQKPRKLRVLDRLESLTIAPPESNRSIVLVNRSPFLMCAIEDEHQRLAAIEPHDRMLREKRSIVLVNRSIASSSHWAIYHFRDL